MKNFKFAFALFFAVSLLLSSCVAEMSLLDPPVFTLKGGTYDVPQSVTIEATDGAVIYYTTDGRTPTTASTLYVSDTPIEVRKASTTLRAISTNAGMHASEIVEAIYTITDPRYNLLETGPAGGLIFHENANYKEDGWKYLESALAGWHGTETADPLSYWGKKGTGGTDFSIGSGESNTSKIVTFDESQSVAAKLCADYSLVKADVLYDDWFLPSRDELFLMFDVLLSKELGGFIRETYWSSTESFQNYAMIQSFLNGSKFNSGRTTRRNWVRPIRAF